MTQEARVAEGQGLEGQGLEGQDRTTTSKHNLTIREIFRTFQVYGVDAYDFWDGKTPGVETLPTVFFRGDENEGQRVVEICRQHEFPLCGLSRALHQKYPKTATYDAGG